MLLTCPGFGRVATPERAQISPGIRQWVTTVTHVSDHAKYRWLNDAVCVGTGRVKPKPVANAASPTDLTLDVAELIWEPLAP